MSMGNLFFLLAMIFASSLNFAKALIVAGGLAQIDFGYYSAFIGALALTATLLSFGQIEATTKLYPRLWAEGQYRAVFTDAKACALVMMKRTLAAAMVLYLAKLSPIPIFPHFDFPILLIAAMSLFIWFSALLMLTTAVLRSIGSVAFFQIFALARGVFPLALVSAVLFSKNWEIIFVAEALATGLTVLFGVMLIRRSAKGAASEIFNFDQNRPRQKRNNAEGRDLYFANLSSSALQLGDRALVTAITGPLAGGTYAVIALIVQAGNLLSGIISQKVGPEIIRACHRGLAIRKTLSFLRFPIFIMLLAAVGIFLFLSVGPMFNSSLKVFLESRSIGVDFIFLGSILVFLQVFLVFQFPLIAVNNEKQVLKAGLGAFLVGVGAGGACLWMGYGVLGFLIALIFARLVQVLLLISPVFFSKTE